MEVKTSGEQKRMNQAGGREIADGEYYYYSLTPGMQVTRSRGWDNVEYKGWIRSLVTVEEIPEPRHKRRRRHSCARRNLYAPPRSVVLPEMAQQADSLEQAGAFFVKSMSGTTGQGDVSGFWEVPPIDIQPRLRD
jgi:hypothetical protein